ncbi:MAG: cobalamin biosynthesis protein, partial [Clostridia bacterium]|nr:cobalamin biosynthesis protein [Clostridia bacterium]
MFGIWSLFALVTGAVIDLALGDPHWLPHPVVLMGKLISTLEKLLRRIFPKTERGENVAGGVLWAIVTALAFLVSAALLMLCHHVSPWLGFGIESV